MSKSDKQITEWTTPRPHEVEVVSARMGADGLDAHFHDAWSIGAILEGVCSFRSGSRDYQARKGDLFLIPPFEVHRCSAASSNVQYRVLYVADTYLLNIDASRFSTLANTSRRIFTAPLLVERIATLSASQDDSLPVGALLRALAAFLPWMPDADLQDRDAHPLQKAMHLLWQSDVAVDELARHSPHSRWHTVRTFRSQTGLSPSAYLRQLRVLKARFLLGRQQASLSDVAQRLHFADQAHFTRAFKSVFGVTPGRLRNVILQR